jgi:hypothetical protein
LVFPIGTPTKGQTLKVPPAINFKTVNVLRVIGRSYHFVVALWRAKQAQLGFRHNGKGRNCAPGYRRTHPHPEIFGNLVPSLP